MSAEGFVTQLCGVLSRSGCPVENTRPEIINDNPAAYDGNLNISGIVRGLKSAARAAFSAGGSAPQLILVIMPVSLGDHDLTRVLSSPDSAKGDSHVLRDQALCCLHAECGEQDLYLLLCCSSS